jgi:virginiamycin B lyase
VDHGAGTAAISFRHDSKAKNWVHWHSPGEGPHPYAVYVDENDVVWVND